MKGSFGVACPHQDQARVSWCGMARHGVPVQAAVA